MNNNDTFPLYTRAEQAGILSGKSALIVAPTATGKSYIGRRFCLGNIGKTEPGINVYLVPFRALARELYETFTEEANRSKIYARIRIATGDHTDPIRPEETDILVATYERFASLRYDTGIKVSSVVADEFHLVADETRGPFVESLMARMRAGGKLQRFLGLSAVIENGRQLADWLEIDLIEGTASDRAVPVEFNCKLVKDKPKEVGSICREALTSDKQVLVFCNSRAGAEKQAVEIVDNIQEILNEDERPRAHQLAMKILAEDDEADKLANVVKHGIAFHHAGLSRGTRSLIEEGYHEGSVRIISCTPTLAAGVNLPAELVLVRDIYRHEFLRGRQRTVVLPSGEVINMLGRAGRPGQVDKGNGIALIDNQHKDWEPVKELEDAVIKGRGNPVQSRMPDSFEPLMRFVLSVVREYGETTMEEIAQAFRHTLWHTTDPQEVKMDRPFEMDMMEDIPSYQKVMDAKGSIRLGSCKITVEGITGNVMSGDHSYEFTMRLDRLECKCPASSRYYRNQVCKHLACAIHDLLFAEKIKKKDPELHFRAIYLCAHLFSKTLDIGTKLNQAVEILEYWGMLMPVAGGAYRTTPSGEVAAETSWDLLLVRDINERIKEAPGKLSYKELASAIVEDFYGNEAQGEKWDRAVKEWIGEVDIKKIKLPTKFRGDFENGRDELSRVARLYARLAENMGRDDIRNVAVQTAGSLLYGVAPELVPLRALNFRDLGRARARILYEIGVRNVNDLCSVKLNQIPSRIPSRLAREWINKAGEISTERKRIQDLDEKQHDAALDELINRFRIDQESIVQVG